MYHKQWFHFFKIAGVEKCCKMSECNIFIENLQKYLKCTGKHSVKVQIGIDAENNKKCRAENWTENYVMKMTRLQYILSVKTN